MSIDKIIKIIFISFLIIWYIPPILYFKLGWFKKYFHDILKWHIPTNGPQSFDGCSYHTTCKHCGEKIMQDSHGNWFC